MAIAIRTRAVQEIIWEKEDALVRSRRRRRLALFDTLLTQLEECNLRHGGEVPDTLRAAAGRAGVPCGGLLAAPELIEAIFEIQEQLMLAQLSPVPIVEDLRRRIAV